MWRSENEMLDVVVERAGSIRTRRRQVTGAGTSAAVVLVAALAVLAGRSTGGDVAQQVQVAAPGGSAAGSATGIATEEPTTTVAPPPTLPFARPSTTVQPARSASTLPVTPRTTVGSATATTVPAPPTTVPESPPANLPPACSAAHVTSNAAAEKASYATGEAVRVDASIRNSSSRACLAQASGWSYEVYDGNNVKVPGAGRGISATHDPCNAPVGDCVWPAGETRSVRLCWDQLAASGPGGSWVQVPAGTYTVRVLWPEAPGLVSTASFQIAPGSAGTASCP